MKFGTQQINGSYKQNAVSHQSNEKLSSFLLSSKIRFADSFGYVKCKAYDMHHIINPNL